MGNRPVHELHAAIVGGGFIGVIHVEALRRLGVQVTGLVDVDNDQIRAKTALGILPEPYPSFDAMLNDDRVDVVHITTPNHLHFEQAKAVLEAGKHVVCEKPLAMNSAESRELVSRARKSGKVCAVNFNVRYYPNCRQAQALCAAGDLGELWNVHGSYLQDWLLLPTDWNWRLMPESGGSLRAVADIGSHWLDLICCITGFEPESVCADLATFVPVRERPTGPVETFAAAAESGTTVAQPIDTEDAAHILLRFAGGARGAVSVSQVNAGRKNALTFEISGSRAAVAWRSERPEELWIGHREAPNEVLLRDPSLLRPEARAGTSLPGGHAEGFQETFKELHRTVYRAVGAGVPPEEPDYPTFEDGHVELLLGEAIAKSASERRWVDVEKEEYR